MAVKAESPWVENPVVRTNVEHGKGKSVVRGPVRIAFTDADTAFITTEAHHNDDLPALTFRDTEWLASEHFRRAADGTWAPTNPHSKYGVSRRGSFSSDDTPRTYRAAIIDAMRAAVEATWTPELARQAAYASAMQALHSALGEQHKARTVLAEIDARVRGLRAHAAENAPRGS